jgi:hypothetical protein
MASLCASHDLFDVLALFHGPEVQIPTHARGTKRLDYCLSSSSLEGLSPACGYNLFNEYIHSDHRAMFLDIRLKEFLGHGTPKLASPDLRFVSSASPDVNISSKKCFLIYTKTKCSTNTGTSFLTKTSSTSLGSSQTRSMSTLVMPSNFFEASCYKHPKPPWSGKLHLPTLKLRFWRTALTEHLTKVPQSAVLRNLAAEIWKTAPPGSLSRFEF